MAKSFKKLTTFGVQQWKANLHKLKHPRTSAKHHIQRGRTSGTTWPTGEIAIAIRPRVLHNQQRA